MIVNFFPLKYIGVPRKDEILSDPTSFAYKCRKYSSWRKIRSSKEDPSRLHHIASSLLDGKSVPIEDFPVICLVWEKVQRWKMDKLNLSIEPPIRPEWQALYAFLKIAIGSPQIVMSSLQDENVVCEDFGKEDLLTLFYIRLIKQFAQTALLTLEDSALNQPLSQIHPVNIESYSIKLLSPIYKNCCLDFKQRSTLTSTFHNFFFNIGVIEQPNINLDFQISTNNVGRKPEQVTIRHGELASKKIISITSSKGVTVVTVNKNHPFLLKHINSETTNAFDEIFKSLGKTYMDMIGQADFVEDFFDYLGLNLSKN